MVKSCFFQIRSIARLKPILPRKDLEKVINAFVLSRLDYCNVLYMGFCQTTISHLQLVQNGAAWLLGKVIIFLLFWLLLSGYQWTPG